MKLYNALTRKKEEFIPIDGNNVKMYNCGPTVYNYFHVGNARNFVVFDTLRRYLEYIGYNVTFVQNFTDIDDKMINQANADGITINDLAQKYIAEYFTDAHGLGIKNADIHPRATENIGEMIKLIKSLQLKDYAYEIDGDVYFDTSSYPAYGRLSGHKLDELEAGARVQINSRKKNPADFALWKSAKPGEPSWGSPWGKGRPGWHLECSAMSMKYLGETIDIHSGGRDLIFPHHENEVAQSEASTGKPFVKFWLHNGFINVDNEKMSKSLGNFFTVRDIVSFYSYEEIRFFLLSAQYRSPVNFSYKLMEQSKNGLDRIYGALGNLSHLFSSSASVMSSDENVLLSNLMKYRDSYISHMDDDLNTADAIADIFDIVKDINLAINDKILRSKEAAKKAMSLITELGGIMGILQKDIEVKITTEIQKLIDRRTDARKQKDFKTSDDIRDRLRDLGIIIEDTTDGCKVKYI